MLVAPSGAIGVKGSYPIYDPAGIDIYYRDDATNRTIKRFAPGGVETTVLTSTWSLGQSGDLAGRQEARIRRRGHRTTTGRST